MIGDLDLTALRSYAQQATEPQNSSIVMLTGSELNAVLDRLETAEARAEAATSSLAREIAATSTRTYEHTRGPVDVLVRLLADEQLQRAIARAEGAEAAVKRVEALHRPMPVYDDECGDMECEREHVEINEDLYHADQIAYQACEQCSDNAGETFPEHVEYPCATRRALESPTDE